MKIEIENNKPTWIKALTTVFPVFPKKSSTPKEDSNFINKTSYIENCETSAVGRALGIFGIGVDTSIASAEEVLNAINNQKDKTAKQVEAFATLGQVEMIKELVPDIKKITDYYQIEKLEDLTVEQASEIIKKKQVKKNEWASKSWK